MSGPGSPARGVRVAAALAVVVVLALVAVLVGLVGSGGSGPGSEPPSTSATPSRPTRLTSPSPVHRSPVSQASSGLRVVALTDLPREARATVALIDRGGPFPYDQDGVTFGNYERVLPAQPRGWYREYTVRTPGERDRGPRRIVTGDHDRLIFYTADHYASFVSVSR